MAKLDVLYQFDNNYASIAGVSLTTLFRNNTDIDEMTVYMAAKDVEPEHLAKLDQLAKQYGRKLVYLKVDHIYQQLKDMGVASWNGSLAIWLKMFVIDSVPESVDQLLYIDSDTLVNQGLKELAEMDLGEYPVGAVIDSSSRTSKERLHLDNPYYNSGVMYINTRLWRRNQIQTAMLEHLKKNAANYPVPDQDLLNDFFRGRILTLSPRYNFQGMHYFYKDKAYFPAMAWDKGEYYSPEEIAECRKNPCIIHFFRFCGEYPWVPDSIHSCRPMFLKALEESLWKGFQYTKKPLALIFRIEKILYRILPQKLFMKLLLHAKS